MSDTGRVQQTAQTAKEEASTTAGQVKQAAGDVTSTAVEQARNVAGEARQQVGSAVHDLQQRVRAEADSQVQRLSGTLRQWAQDLSGLADNAPSDSPARDLVAQAAHGGHRAADYLDENGMDGTLQNLQAFARRRPGAFLGSAMLAGLVVGRIAKAGKQAAQSSSDTSLQTPPEYGAPQPSEQPSPLPPASQVPPAPATPQVPPAPPVPPAPATPPPTSQVPPHPGV